MPNKQKTRKKSATGTNKAQNDHKLPSDHDITKTYVYNFDPLKPHFYTVKLGFTGYTLFFLLLLKNIDCGYSLEPPWWGSSNKYPQSMFWAEIWKNVRIFILKISVFGGEIFNIFEQASFRNE